MDLLVRVCFSLGIKNAPVEVRGIPGLKIQTWVTQFYGKGQSSAARHLLGHQVEYILGAAVVLFADLLDSFVGAIRFEASLAQAG